MAKRASFAELQRRRAVLLSQIVAGAPMSQAARRAGYRPSYIHSRSADLWQTAATELEREVSRNRAKAGTLIGTLRVLLETNPLRGVPVYVRLVNGGRLSLVD
jgi:hypothetical protein